MNADRLLALLEPISEAPDAIPRMRRFILDLAVRGKLVEQDPEDEPAGELLYRIQQQKERMALSGEIKKPKEDISVFSAAQSQSPQLPQGWSLCRLDETSICLDYKRKPVNGAERQKRIEGKLQEQLFPYFGATQQQGWIDDYLFDDELVLLGEDGVPFFDALRPKAYIISGKTWVNNHAHVFKPILAEAGYLVHCLNAFDYSGRVAGTTRSKLNQAKAVDIPISFPPLAEQHRIVAKVDELMAFCDQLETARMQREQCRERLVAASLQRLNQTSDESESFRGDARFALQVLPRLTTTPAQIKQLRQTILNLAVRGKLVEQDPEDEPAIITITGALLAAADSPRKKGRRKASWSPPTENENQELPAGWHLFSLSELVDPASPLSYGVLVPGDNVPDGIPFVRAQDLMLKDHPASPGKRIAQEIDGKYKRTQLTGGEILICVVGSIGKIGIVPEHWSGANIARAVARLKLIPEVSTAYMLLALQSGMIQGFFKDSTRTLAQPTLNISLIEVAPILLPPLAEQHRIVAKVDELMALCYQLEQQLSQAEQSRRVLLEAVLQEALAGPEPVLQSLARP
jgi:type I restriction enzyme S subunit